MTQNRTKFDIWWNSPEVKQKLGAAYSLGAAIVIIGAMFKILHLPGAALMLGIGMSVEAFLFALGVFDQPHKEYEWEKVYDFEGTGLMNGNNNVAVGGGNAAVQTTIAPSRAVGLNYSETINDDDVKKLSEGIRNLSTTAEQFSGLSSALGAADQFVKTINNASDATGKFIRNQESLTAAAGQLTVTYAGVTEGMGAVERNTKVYASNVEEINRNLSSINSIYEIQLKNIQAQSEGIMQQTDRVRTVTDGLGAVVGDVQKMKAATQQAAEESENFRAGTVKLSKQVADLNQVYGNMLNALS